MAVKKMNSDVEGKMKTGNICLKNMNTKVVKICKHKKTFVDDFLDVCDKLAEIFNCQKNKTNNFFIRKKKNENYRAENMSQTNNLTNKKNYKKSDSNSKKTQTKIELKNISKNTSTPNLCTELMEAKLKTRNNNTEAEKADYQYSNNNLKGKSNEDEVACIQKSLEELIIQSEETVKKQENIIKQYEKYRFSNAFSASFHNKKEVYTSDSGTQYENSGFSEKERVSGTPMQSMRYFKGSPNQNRTDGICNCFQRFRLEKDDDFEKLYSNYKNKFRTKTKPTSSINATMNNTGFNSKTEKAMSQPKTKCITTPKYKQGKLSEAYDHGAPIKNSSSLVIRRPTAKEANLQRMTREQCCNLLTNTSPGKRGTLSGNQVLPAIKTSAQYPSAMYYHGELSEAYCCERSRSPEIGGLMETERNPPRATKAQTIGYSSTNTSPRRAKISIESRPTKTHTLTSTPFSSYYCSATAIQDLSYRLPTTTQYATSPDQGIYPYC